MEWRPPQKSSRKFTYIYLKVGIRNHKIILIPVFVLVCGLASAQITVAESRTNGLTLRYKRSSFVLPVGEVKGLDMPVNYTSLLRSASGMGQISGGFNLRPVPKNQYVEGFAFFCRQELRVEKKLGIPVRVRVGSLEQCDKLEQKQ